MPHVRARPAALTDSASHRPVKRVTRSAASRLQSVMTDIDFENKHPRQDGGKFAAKEGTASAIMLDMDETAGGYLDVTECVETGAHHRSTDGNGYCNFCGRQEPGFERGTSVWHTPEGAAQPSSARVTRMYETFDGELMAELIYTDGNTHSAAPAWELEADEDADNAASIERTKRVDAALALLAVNDATASERRHMVDIRQEINDGTWGDIHERASRALSGFEQEIEQAADGLDAKEDAIFEQQDFERLKEGFNDAHQELANGERKQASNGQWAFMAEPRDDQNERIAANAIAQRTAAALYFRDRIGDDPNWTQEAYDHITRPYREAVGPIHPDDEQTPASWALRQHTVLSPARKYEGYSAPALRAQRDILWDEYQEASHGEDADFEGRAKRAWETADIALSSRNLA